MLQTSTGDHNTQPAKMEKFIVEQITPIIKRHGLSVILLCGAIYWQNTKMIALEKDMDSLTEKYEQCLMQNSTISVKQSIIDIQADTEILKKDMGKLKTKFHIDD